MKVRTLGMAAALVAASLNVAKADTLRMECAPTGAGKEFCDYVKERFETQTGHTLEFIEFPPSSDEKLGLFQQLFAARDADAVDLFQADTVWVGLLDRHTLDLTDQVAELEADFFPGAWQNNIVNGRVKAVPAFLDAGALYYRQDLLEKYGEQPPASWEELTRIATRIQEGERTAGHRNFWGLVFQGKSYEGLTCNALEWVASHGGGDFVDVDGQVTIDNPQAARALDLAAGWVGTIAPQGALGYMEEEARAVFQNGGALFMRNWPYAYVLAQADNSPVKGKVGVMPLPSGADGESVATLGGWQWSVSAYSKNPEAAVTLLKIVSDAEAQKKALQLVGVAPSRVALYEDPEVLAMAPYLAEFRDIFANARPRPATQTKGQYARVSNAIYNATYNVLSGRSSGEQAVADLQSRLERIKGREWR